MAVHMYRTSSKDNVRGECSDSCMSASSRDIANVMRFEQIERFRRMKERAPDGSIAKFALTWPITYNVTTTILLPLAFLIVLSFLCGHFLAVLESETEIRSNDESIRSRAVMVERIIFFGSLSQELPKKCLAEFMEKQNISNAEDDEVTTVNMTELQIHLEGCSDNFANTAQRTFLTNTQRDLFHSQNVSTDVTFNWIKCRENSSMPLSNDGQYAFISSEYEKDLLQNYVAELEAAGVTNLTDEQKNKLLYDRDIPGVDPFVTHEAYKRANERSSGGARCEVNSAGGAWFWFTIMSTIGYGNAAPVTLGGRAFVYSLGFICVLVFTGTLGNAGNSVVTIFEDYCRHRNNKKLKKLALPFYSMCLWLTLYYLWMLVIAIFSIMHRRMRTGESFSFRDAFWFSYITTTTVGLGDFHVEHEGFEVQDMFFLPVLMLAGFVLLANFLLSLSEYIMHILPSPSDNMSFIDILQLSRARLDVPCFHSDEFTPQVEMNSNSRKHPKQEKEVGDCGLHLSDDEQEETSDEPTSCDRASF